MCSAKLAVEVQGRYHLERVNAGQNQAVQTTNTTELVIVLTVSAL